MNDKCARCDNHFDTATAIDETGGKPVEGDVSLCLYCGYIAKFDANGGRVEMPLNELIVNCDLHQLALLANASILRYSDWIKNVH